MSDIPIEIFREILRRVPVEPLFRLRSVCKKWLCIIDDPAFAKMQIHRGKGEDWLIVKPYNGGKIYLFPLKEMVSKKVPSVKWVLASNVKNLVGRGVPRIHRFPVPSCNGLILISSCNKNMFWRIWNPFTVQSLELGKCDGFANDTCGNIDDPYSGIGYDEATDDYKVVRIDKFHTYIYSVNSKVWRRIEDFPFPGFCILGKNGIFAYDVLHWVAYPEEENEHLELGSIAALDLSTEKYRKVSVPSEIAESPWYTNPRLVALNECLFISVNSLNGHFVMWAIKGYGCENTWVKIISLKGGFHWTPIAYLKSKERILLYRDKKSQICCWYDLVKKCTVRNFLVVLPEIDDLDVYRCSNFRFSCQVFPASLVRLMGSDVANESVASEGTLKKKRNRTVANERLEVKIIFEDDEDLFSGDETSRSD